MSHGAAERHPGDVVRVVAGTSIVAAGAAVARQGRLSALETDVFRLVNDLPGELEGPLRVAMQAGALAAVGVTAGAALVARRPALARDVTLAGGGAWVAAKVAKALVDRARPGGFFTDVVFRGPIDAGMGYPSGHAAVAAAIATAAAPHLGRTGRRVAWGGVAVVGIARMYVGAHLPVDVVGGAALGWVLGALVHLIFGAPSGQLDERQVRAALAGVEPGPFEVSRASVDARGSTPFFVVTPSGDRWFVKAVGRQQRNADVLFKLWRALSRRRLEDETPFVTAKQQVEHEACLSLLAEQAGVRTPEVVALRSAGGGTTLLGTERVDGRGLDTVDPETVSDAVLTDLWTEVGRLRAAHIAHRDLRLANVLLDESGRPWLIDFGFAEASASPRRLAQDVAELLASSASLVGAKRAVAAAATQVGTDGLAAALPLLQPMALSKATHSSLRPRTHLLDEVRSEAAAAAGVDEPALEPLARVRPRTLLMLAFGLFAVHLLLPQVGELRRSIDTLDEGEPGWLVVALACSMATYLAAGLSLLGAVSEPLSYARTTFVQVASSFANRITPGSLGGVGVNIRYLERAGIDRDDAYAAVALNSVAGGAVHIGALIIAVILTARSDVDLIKLPDGGEILIVVVVLLAGLGLLLWSPLGRRRVVPPTRQAVASVLAVVRQPSKAAQLFGGSAAITTLYILALTASLEAFHSPLPIVHVAAVYLGGSALAAVAPTPGGLGAMEAALVAGLTAFGLQSGPAIIGVLAFRLVTFWLPILPGWLAFRSLRRQQVI